ncbi:MAG: HDOD domain-containing protein [Deltaproteobacteria bacterium]|jgi:putative nucleotidyltransferase with HDIG domain|nr:HDOD domain-containing protein [Deltaproteobacteria bacterium]
MESQKIAAAIQSFPGMPGTAVKLLGLIDDPSMRVSQIEEILRHDPGLTANVLRLANSAYFGIPSKIGSIRQAVILLGLKRLIQMVIAACVSAIMDRSVPGYDLPPGELWRHSIAVSVAAEGLVKELKIEASEEIFTAALLHDVGKLVLGVYVKDDFNEIARAVSEGASFEAAETMVLGTNHADVGAKILTRWSLPAEIVNAVQWHHDPESLEHTSFMLDVVHVANVMSLLIGIGIGRDGLQHQPSVAVSERLGLEPCVLEKVASQTTQWVTELSGVLEPG